MKSIKWLLCIVALCLSCNSGKTNVSQITDDAPLMNDSVLAQDSMITNRPVDSEEMDDSSVSSDTDDDTEDVDWTPKQFKKEHHDEWVVVKQSIDIQQKGDIDYNQIDKLVKEYIKAKNIILSKDKCQQIKQIEELCSSHFDISGYDESNMGMLIADGTALLFEDYIIWLYDCAAQKAKETGINTQDEREMLNRLMDAFFNCCDSVGDDFGGSGGWVGRNEVYRISNAFRKSMFEAILNPQSPKEQRLLLTPKHFEDECKVRCTNYKKDWERAPSPESVKAYLSEYSNAMKNWLEYRGKVENGISNPTLRSEYSYLTRTFAREHFIHLKNVFGDIGLYSESMYEKCFLHLDCSDEEMLNYSYEKALKKYLNE